MWKSRDFAARAVKQQKNHVFIISNSVTTNLKDYSHKFS